MTKRLFAGLAATFLMLASGIASAAPYNLVNWYQRSGGGNLSALAFKAGPAQGCTGPTYTQPCYAPAQPWTITNNVVDQVDNGLATWDWNSGTQVLTSTGLFWASSFIGSNPSQSTVISDKVTDLVIDIASPGVGTANAATYECVEGTFLATVFANGCKNTHLGVNLVENTTTVWNSGGNAKCVVQTISPDDWSLLDGTGPSDTPPGPYTPGTPEPRGVTAQAAGAAGPGCSQASGAFDMFHVIVDDGTYLIISESSNLGTCFIHGVLQESGCTLDENDPANVGASSSFLVFAAPGAPDSDSDGNFDGLDNCPANSNPGQQDLDADGVGDACDGDTDGDGFANASDNCPLTNNPTQADTDTDLRGNACDNCSSAANMLAGTVPNSSPVVNKAQLDSDSDGYGNACDADLNNSGGTTATDYSILRSVIGKLYNFSTNAAKSDLNASGSVTATDYSILRSRIGTAPGPSGLACAGTVPCVSP